MNKKYENLAFTATHEWLKYEGDECQIGITDHAQELLGDMVFVELPQVGDEVKMGQELAVVESVKAASDVYAPITGVITAVNQSVTTDPALLNQDPFGAGWLIKIKPTQPDDLKSLLSGDQYELSIAGEAE